MRSGLILPGGAWALIYVSLVQVGVPEISLSANGSVHPMAKFSPFKFMQEVRSETDKVTWPTRKETTITTIMVFVMVAVASVLFTVADQVIRLLITFILQIQT